MQLIEEKIQLHIGAGNYRGAIELASEALELDQRKGTIYFLKGLAESQLQLWTAAEHSFLAAIEHGSIEFDVFYYLAKTYSKLSNKAQASVVLQQGLDLISEEYIDREWHEPLSRLLYAIEKYEESIFWAHKHLDMHPSDTAVLKRLGSALLILQRPMEALKTYQKVLDLTPHDPQLHSNLSAILRQLRELDAAQKHLEVAAKLDNTYYDPSTLFMLSASRLDFPKRQKYAADAVRDALADRPISDPFSFFFATDDPFIIKKANASYAQRFPKGNRSNVGSIFRSPDGRIKIGYLSADFKEHATAYLIDRLIREHDRSSFHITAFDFSKDQNTEYQLNLRNSFDTHVDLMSQSHERAAEIIASHNIDILVDLKGFTEHSRPQILSHRPGRIQVNYLGYPGTTGLSYLDYIIGDSIVFAEDSQAEFEEAQVTLPCCYQPNNPNRIKAPLTTRSEHGLPDDAFVFSCFNHHWKMTPEILGAWKTILESCPNSVLWVLDAISETDTKKKLEELGVEGRKVVVAPLIPIQKHLSRLQLADLFLDTFPCGAHTTASDSIFSGVPVLTVMGRAFHSRVSASLMVHAGCPEYVCTSVDEYVEKAISCYGNPQFTKAARSQLQNFNQPWHPYNIQSTRTALEKAYTQMVLQGSDIKPIKIGPW